MKDYGGIDEKLKNGLYSEPALVPESPWLGGETPAKPEVRQRLEDGVEVDDETAERQVSVAVAGACSNVDGWKTQSCRATSIYCIKRDGAPAEVVVSAVSRLGREGQADSCDGRASTINTMTPGPNSNELCTPRAAGRGGGYRAYISRRACRTSS